MRAMLIRPLATGDDADLEAVVRVWNATKRDTYDFPPQEQARSVAEDGAVFRERIAPRCAIWVAVEDGDVLGFVALAGTYVDRLYVRPDAQRRGSAPLFATALAHAPGGVELHTHQKNAKARSTRSRAAWRCASA
jgi:GNAT superfamily N-acetyltransferase